MLRIRPVSPLLVWLVWLVWLPGPSRGAGPAYPLRVAANGRQVLDANGGPVFFHADSPWHLFARLDRAEAIAYLDDRAALGFNALLVSLIVSDGYTGSTRNRAGVEPFLVRDDFATPNEPYFAHVDWIVQQARARGLTLFVVPAYLGYDCGPEGWCAAMRVQGVEAMRKWGRWVGSRYREQPNIVWVNGGDADAAAFGAEDLVDAVAEGIRDVDDQHLHSAHCSRRRSGADCYDRDWLHINSTYSDCALTARHVRADYLREPRRPFAYLEGIYEGESGSTPACLRFQAYSALLGGAFAHFYGSGRIWDFPTGWIAGLESQGARSMSHLVALQRSRRWELMVPDLDGTWVLGERGGLDSAQYVSAARAGDGSSLVVYLPTYRNVTISLTAIAAERVTAWWFDPVEGRATLIGTFDAKGIRLFAPAREQDWVLVLDDAEAGFGPPGIASLDHESPRSEVEAERSGPRAAVSERSDRSSRTASR